MQSESKLCYFNTAYNVIFQLENLSWQTGIFLGSRLLSPSLCTGIFSAHRKRCHKGISLLHFAWTQEAMIDPFSRHQFFGISRCCTIREPFTMPFSVFLFPFAVNLAKVNFPKHWNACKTEMFVWTSKTSHLIGSWNNAMQQHSADHMSRTPFIHVSHGFPS